MLSNVLPHGEDMNVRNEWKDIRSSLLDLDKSPSPRLNMWLEVGERPTPSLVKKATLPSWAWLGPSSGFKLGDDHLLYS